MHCNPENYNVISNVIECYVIACYSNVIEPKVILSFYYEICIPFKSSELLAPTID